MQVYVCAQDETERGPKEGVTKAAVVSPVEQDGELSVDILVTWIAHCIMIGYNTKIQMWIVIGICKYSSTAGCFSV